jgi:hypothetical protein
MGKRIRTTRSSWWNRSGTCAAVDEAYACIAKGTLALFPLKASVSASQVFMHFHCPGEYVRPRFKGSSVVKLVGGCLQWDAIVLKIGFKYHRDDFSMCC